MRLEQELDKLPKFEPVDNQEAPKILSKTSLSRTYI